MIALLLECLGTTRRKCMMSIETNRSAVPAIFYTRPVDTKVIMILVYVITAVFVCICFSCFILLLAFCFVLLFLFSYLFAFVALIMGAIYLSAPIEVIRVQGPGTRNIFPRNIPFSTAVYNCYAFAGGWQFLKTLNFEVSVRQPFIATTIYMLDIYPDTLSLY